MRLRFAGFGGQGVVLCGYIFGKAAMLDGKSSIHTQSYGSASRGGLTKSDVAIVEGEIHDLIHSELDLLVTMSQQSYDKYRSALVAGGLLFFESDLVELVTDRETALPADGGYGVSATDIAVKSFGRRIMANMIMIGFVNQIASVVSYDALAKTIQEAVPAGTEGKNIEALCEGMRLGSERVEK